MADDVTKEYDRPQLIALADAEADRTGQKLVKPATDMTPRELRATLADLQVLPAAPVAEAPVKDAKAKA